MKDFGNHFRALIENEIIDEPRILVPRGGRDMIILVTWRLANDALRANKRSRMVRILITEDALQLYSRGTDTIKKDCDSRFVAWLRQNLSRFDGNHDAPLGVEPPPVTWTVSTFDLNG